CRLLSVVILCAALATCGHPTMNAKVAKTAKEDLALRALRSLRSLEPALGRISFPNSGAAAAQPAFIRGVLLLYSFEYDDAIDAFREAQQVDPGFALAYWGEAMCYNQPLWYNENVDKARQALGRLAADAAARQA